MEKKPTEIPSDTPYGVVDAQTGRVVFRTSYRFRRRARGYADRQDARYGAVRYIPQILNT